MKFTLLIIDDSAWFVESAISALSRKFTVRSADSPEDAKIKLDNSVDLVLLDLVFNEDKPDLLQGMEFIPYVKGKYPDLPVIVMTNYSSTDKAVEAIKLGAEDFFNKKDLLWSDWIDKISNYCKKYQRIRDLEKQKEELESRIFGTSIIGISDVIKTLRKQLITKAQRSSDMPIVLVGETGTGKNLAANFFHLHSLRKNGPLIEFSIYELSPSVLESDLFGCVKGAFTGATENKIGKLEAANGGTLFFDEISDYDLHIQAKIMRFIENKTIIPVGGTKAKALDIQIILATNQDLMQLRDAGKLRNDLYQRIWPFTIKIPPLRERLEDIEELANYFFEYYRSQDKTFVQSISDEVIQLFKNYSWPGNVRELRNVIQNAIEDARQNHDTMITVKNVREEIQEKIIEKNNVYHDDETDLKKLTAIDQLKRIDDALAETLGQKEKAANMLGINADSLRYRVKSIFQKYPGLTGEFGNISKYYKRLLK